MDELIKRLESATEGSRELDAAIIMSGLHVSMPDDPVGWPPKFTTSIDAALTLVPAGRPWSITQQSSGVGYFADIAIKDDDGWWFEADGPGSEAPTPALALCIAALRARSAS